MDTLLSRFIGFENALHGVLVRHSVNALRVSFGAIFLLFGVLKYFPGVSPAAKLATDTTHVLFLGLVPSDVAIVIVATMECFIGICFLIGSGLLMRVAIWVLAAQFVGILSPLIIEPGTLFSGPHHAPTLAGQYVLKDIVLLAAGAVIAAGTFRGGRMVRQEPQPRHRFTGQGVTTEDKVRVIFAASIDGASVAEVCAEQGVSEAEFYEWRDLMIDAGAAALEEAPPAVLRDA